MLRKTLLFTAIIALSSVSACKAPQGQQTANSDTRVIQVNVKGVPELADLKQTRVKLTNDFARIEGLIYIEDVGNYLYIFDSATLIGVRLCYESTEVIDGISVNWYGACAPA